MEWFIVKIQFNDGMQEHIEICAQNSQHAESKVIRLFNSFGPNQIKKLIVSKGHDERTINEYHRFDMDKYLAFLKCLRHIK